MRISLNYVTLTGCERGDCTGITKLTLTWNVTKFVLFIMWVFKRYRALAGQKIYVTIFKFVPQISAASEQECTSSWKRYFYISLAFLIAAHMYICMYIPHACENWVTRRLGHRETELIWQATSAGPSKNEWLFGPGWTAGQCERDRIAPRSLVSLGRSLSSCFFGRT